MILLGLFVQVIPAEDNRDSISAYLEIIQNNTDSSIAADAYKKIIDIYMEEGEVDSVEAVVSHIEKDDRFLYREAYRYGLSVLYNHYRDQGEKSKADATIERLARSYGGGSYNYRNSGDYEKEEISIEKIKKLISEKKRKHLMPDPLFLMSYLLVLDSSYAKAEYILLELKNWPDSQAVKEMMPEITYQLGYVYFQSGKYDEAASQFEEWIGKYETGDSSQAGLVSNAYYCLASTYTKLADSETDSDAKAEYYTKAYDAYKKVFESYPASICAARAAMKIIDFNIRAKQINEAVAVTEDVKARLSKNREIYKNAYAYGVLSLIEYSASLIQDKNFPCEQFFKFLNIENYYKLGKTNFESGDYEDARDILSKLKILKECKEAGSIMPEALLILAKSYCNLGNYKEAIAELDEWLEYDEDIKQRNADLLPEVYYYLALSYLSTAEGFCKALENFRIIKNCYRDTEFYKSNGISADIEQKIAECEKACKRPDK